MISELYQQWENKEITGIYLIESSIQRLIETENQIEEGFEVAQRHDIIYTIDGKVCGWQINFSFGATGWSFATIEEEDSNRSIRWMIEPRQSNYLDGIFNERVQEN